MVNYRKYSSFILLCIFTLVAASCGESSSNNAGLSFKIEVQNKAAGKSAAAVASPDICADNGIDTIVATVKDSSGKPVGSGTWPCSAHQGTIGGLPEGSGFTLGIDGLAGSLVVYQGFNGGLTLVNNTVTPAGTVSLVSAAPTTLSATAPVFNQMNLSWTDNAANEDGYRIERSLASGGPYLQIGSVTANKNTYIDSTVVGSATYYYRVKAFGGAGTTAPSNEATATTPATTYSLSGTIRRGSVALSGVTVTLSGSGPGQQTTNNSGNYTFVEAQNGGEYTLVPSKPGYSFAPVSFTVTVGGTNITGMDFYPTASTVPAAPTGLVVTPVSVSQINLTWTDNSINESSYLIERKNGADGSDLQLGPIAADSTSYIDSALSAGVTYTYRIRATNDYNTISYSGYSGEESGKTFVGAVAINPDLISAGLFSIGKYEVTQSEWSTVMLNNPSYFKTCGLDCPVENISWDDVQVFIAKLNELSGKNYRLPTEAEWEYAARSGGLNQTYSGGEDVDAVAWYLINSGSVTHAKKGKTANGLDIYDMSGNVAEWVSDSLTDSISNKIIKGGSCVGPASYQQTNWRGYVQQGSKSQYLGFRLAITNP
jgi:hypothetical protein